MKLYGLQINHIKHPIGIRCDGLRLSWKAEYDAGNHAYQVKILDASGTAIEDSGKVESSNRFYDLKRTLNTRSEYKAVVTSWNAETSDTAEIAFVTGIDRSEWTAQWVNPEPKPMKKPGRRGSYLMKRFALTDNQVKIAQERHAYVYATCHGIMNIYLNGAEITDYQLMPGTQQYDKRLMVETLEISKYLAAGENEILVTLGDGWYRGSMGYGQARNVFGADVALLLELQIAGITILRTDGSWLATQNGPIGANDFMGGEEYDATRELSEWHPVRLENFGVENLIYVDTVPVLPHERFRPVILTTPKGETVLDFGQNLVGYVALSFEGTRGKTLRLTHGEVLDKDGNFTTANFQNPSKSTKQQVTYICKDGENTYHPTKTYMGFRYVLVEADFEIRPEYFTAVAIYSDMDQLVTFECGVPEINQLFQNALWSMKGNFIDVPTDCPTREKSGYSGDCQTFVHTAMYLMDCYSVYAKWIREQAAGQYPDGAIPQISPNCVKPGKRSLIMDKEGGIGWSDSFEIVPYRLYKRYGDDTLIRETYPAQKRWMEYEINRAKKTRRSNRKQLPEAYQDYLIDTGWMWGEWLEPNTETTKYMKNLVKHGDAEVGTAFYFQHLRIMSEMAGIVGEEADAKRYAALAEKVREAYRAVFTDNGAIKEEKRQCRYVRPIAHDLLSAEEKKTAAARLAEMIESNGDHLGTGFLTTHELCRALSDHGQSRKAFDLLFQRDMPGFLYAITKGCTTIPENWNCFNAEGNPKDSFNHYAYGAIVGWLIDSVAGIRIQDGKVTIKPIRDERLGYIKVTYDSPYGLVSSEW